MSSKIHGVVIAALALSGCCFGGGAGATSGAPVLSCQLSNVALCMQIDSSERERITRECSGMGTLYEAPCQPGTTGSCLDSTGYRSFYYGEDITEEYVRSTCPGGTYLPAGTP